ncbi:DeoR/GlpR family DNA-binding transcription regulator [Geminicoccus sp.]|uniref:DeoR/GlpR family DNA-binding transcription regulator n=1 Tax=Geminicoccus sp. TaxID=2024832 RepID=UPI0032C23B8F
MSTSVQPPANAKARRQQRIMAALRAAPAIRIVELATEFEVSTETIRRDLDELGQAGLIARTYGGAARPVASEPAIVERERLMVAERRRIAVAAARLVGSSEAIMLGGGSTTLKVARQLAGSLTRATIVTHGFAHAAALAANPNVRVLMVPGRYEPSEGIVVGAETVDHVGRFHAEVAIVGASGITLAGAADVDDEAAAVYRAMRLCADRVLTVADHGKFGRPAFAIHAELAEMGHLVTDQPPPEPLARALAMAEVQVTVAA